MVQKDLSGPSAFRLVVGVLSTIGGIFTFVDTIYAFVFGTTIVAIITGMYCACTIFTPCAHTIMIPAKLGSKPISPFGLLGIFASQKIMRMVGEQFPELRKDCERGGMASYIREVGINVGFVDDDIAHPSSGTASPDADLESGARLLEVPPPGGAGNFEGGHGADTEGERN